MATSQILTSTALSCSKDSESSIYQTQEETFAEEAIRRKCDRLLELGTFAGYELNHVMSFFYHKKAIQLCEENNHDCIEALLKRACLYWDMELYENLWEDIEWALRQCKTLQEKQNSKLKGLKTQLTSKEVSVFYHLLSGLRFEVTALQLKTSIDKNNLSESKKNEIEQEILNHKKEAQSCYEKALELDNHNVYPHFFIGYLHMERKQYEISIECFKRALENKPKYSPCMIYNNIAWSLNELNRIEESLLYFQKCIESNPRCIKGLYNRAKVYVKRKEYEKALKDYDYILKIDSSLSNIYLERGFLFEFYTQDDKKEQKNDATGDPQQSDTEPNELLNNDPMEIDDTVSNLPCKQNSMPFDPHNDIYKDEFVSVQKYSDLHSLKPNIARAIANYRKALALDPTNKYAYLFLASTEFTCFKNESKCISWLNQGINCCIRRQDIEFLYKRRSQFYEYDLKDKIASERDSFIVKCNDIDPRSHLRMKQNLYSLVRTVSHQTNESKNQKNGFNSAYTPSLPPPTPNTPSSPIGTYYLSYWAEDIFNSKPNFSDLIVINIPKPSKNK